MSNFSEINDRGAVLNDKNLCSDILCQANVKGQSPILVEFYENNL